MKLLGGLLGLLIVLAVIGFLYLGFSDTSVEQTAVTKTIPLQIN
jgi:hypothetical protein